MTSTAKTLIVAQDAPDALTEMYVSPVAGKGTWLDKITGINHTSTTTSLDIYLVPAGGVPDATNRVIRARSMSEDYLDTFPELVGKFLAPGDAIHMDAGAANAISVAANGRELT